MSVCSVNHLELCTYHCGFYTKEIARNAVAIIRLLPASTVSYFASVPGYVYSKTTLEESHTKIKLGSFIIVYIHMSQFGVEYCQHWYGWSVACKVVFPLQEI